MKTKLEYRINKFKKIYGYDSEEETIVVPIHPKTFIEVYFDLHVESSKSIVKSLLPNENGRDELVKTTNVRSLSADTGIFNIPTIHVNKEFFMVDALMQKIMLYHEIGHIRLQLLNIYDYDFILTSKLSHPDIYRYIIDMKLQSMNESIDVHSVYKRFLEDVESRFSREGFNCKPEAVIRLNIFKRIMEIVSKEFGDPYFCLFDSDFVALEIEAYLYSFMSAGKGGYARAKRYDLVEFPHIGKRINQEESKKLCYNIKKFWKCIDLVLTDPYVSENILIYTK